MLLQIDTNVHVHVHSPHTCMHAHLNPQAEEPAPLYITMDPSHPDPSLIGKAFVKQYYTQLHHDPSQMHRFYLEQSTMVHGGSELGSAERVVGQKVQTASL